MSKFKVTITRTDEYEIEVDENVWGEEGISKWSKVFFPASATEDIAKHFAVAYMKEDRGSFIEGFGYVKDFRSDGSLRKIFFTENDRLKELPEDKYTKGMSIKPIDYDENYETEIEKIS